MQETAVLAETPRLERFFSAKLLSSNVKTVALTGAPKNVGKNNDICFEAPFKQPDWLYLHVIFFSCFYLQSLVCAYCSGECCFLPSHALAQWFSTFHGL